MSLSKDTVRVAVVSLPRGQSEVNTSALAIITHEAPIRSGYGVSQTYKKAEDVEAAFGSHSVTYQLALSVFQQESNLLLGRGFLVVIPRKPTVPDSPAVLLGRSAVDFTQLTADDYVIKAFNNGLPIMRLEINKLDLTDIKSVEKSLNSQSAVSDNDLMFSVTGDITNALVTVQTKSAGSTANLAIEALPATEPGTDLGSAIHLAAVNDLGGEATGRAAGVESIQQAILRTSEDVSYFGIIYTEKLDKETIIETASTVQSLGIMQFVGSDNYEDIHHLDSTGEEDGTFPTILKSGFNKTRGLFYGENELGALKFAAGYASILFSTNFDAINTALTMNLQPFRGLTADKSLDNSQRENAKRAGVDMLLASGNDAVCVSYGANLYADQVYNRQALQVDLQIAGYNLLAKAGTKIPQTEERLIVLKGALRKVLRQYVAAGVFAPGEWHESKTFGLDPEVHVRNIRETGYFIYSLPVAEQTQSNRILRIAPTVQIAVKESGAIHGADVVVLVAA